MGYSIDILANVIIPGDASSQHACDLARVLMQAGHNVHLYHDGAFTRPEEDVRQISTQIAASEYHSEAQVVILEYSGWYELAECFRDVHGARIFWYHGVTPLKSWRSDVDRAYLAKSELYSRLARSAAIAVADSPFGAQELGQNTLFPRCLTRVIPLAIDCDEFTSQPTETDIQSIRHTWGITDRRTLLYVGRLAGNKRIDLIVEALHLLRQRHPDLHLLIVGDDCSSPAYGECAQALRNQIHELGLGERVTLTGKVPDVNVYYQIADIFALASEHEGFGAPLIEAMAANVPIVASNSAAIPWVLGDENPNECAGLLFTPGSAPDLAEKIDWVLSDCALADRLRKNGQARARRFSLEYFAQETLAVIADALAVKQLERGPVGHPAEMCGSLLERRADVALRDYHVHSHTPVLGKLIEWLRFNLTVHVKEAYLDPIIERQVTFNTSAARQISSLENDVYELEKRLRALDEAMRERQ